MIFLSWTPIYFFPWVFPNRITCHSNPFLFDSIKFHRFPPSFFWWRLNFIDFSHWTSWNTYFPVRRGGIEQPLIMASLNGFPDGFSPSFKRFHLILLHYNEARYQSIDLNRFTNCYHVLLDYKEIIWISLYFFAIFIVYFSSRERSGNIRQSVSYASFTFIWQKFNGLHRFNGIESFLTIWTRTHLDCVVMICDVHCSFVCVCLKRREKQGCLVGGYPCESYRNVRRWGLRRRCRTSAIRSMDSATMAAGGCRSPTRGCCCTTIAAVSLLQNNAWHPIIQKWSKKIKINTRSKENPAKWIVFFIRPKADMDNRISSDILDTSEKGLSSHKKPIKILKREENR